MFLMHAIQNMRISWIECSHILPIIPKYRNAYYLQIDHHVGCSTGEYLCDDGKCRMGSRCNGINDCDDGSDESSCSNAVLQLSPGFVNNALTRPDTTEEGAGAMSYGK